MKSKEAPGASSTAAEVQGAEMKLSTNLFYEIESCRRCSFYKITGLLASVIRIQLFQGDLHSPEMSTAMHDPQITMGLQFHLEHPQGCLQNNAPNKLLRNQSMQLCNMLICPNICLSLWYFICLVLVRVFFMLRAAQSCWS